MAAMAASVGAAGLNKVRSEDQDMGDGSGGVLGQKRARFPRAKLLTGSATLHFEAPSVSDAVSFYRPVFG
eukprot:1559115-Pyramimonas_sp.AAC.1